MNAATYVRFEVLRSFRNWRFFAFSLVFPLVLYLLTVGANRDVTDFAGTGLSIAVYFMAGMVAWGTMTAAIAGGARIAPERAVGWVRQLRITPLRVGPYFGAKIVSGYAVAASTIVVLYLAGIAMGTAWLAAIIGVLVASWRAV